MAKKGKQLDLPIREKFRHGGRRKGAGRPKSSRYQPHLARTEFHSRNPLHVTVRLKDGLPTLRGKQLYHCFREAVLKAQKRGLRITEFAVLSNHLHLILEAEGAHALSGVMQSLGISLAKRINAKLVRTGPVLRERYHVHILKTPREVRHAIAYVLGNAFKHSGKRGRIALDALSSAILASDAAWRVLLGRDWRQVVGFPQGESPPETDAMEAAVRELVAPPTRWLLREGRLTAAG